MKFSYSIGIDISRSYFDVSVLIFSTRSRLIYGRFVNSSQGFTSFLKWLIKHEIELCSSLFCMEATGMDSEPLAEYLSKGGYAVWVGDPQTMSKAMSANRDKTDPLDAYEIGLYAIRFCDKYRAFVPLSDTLKKIRELFRLRTLLVNTEKQVKSYINGAMPLDSGLDLELAKLIKPLQEQKKGIIKQIEKNIKQTIKSDARLCKVYKHALSVRGVGFVTAVYLLIITRGFTRFDKLKELACYSGIVPHRRQSGSSYKGKSKLHRRGNKRLKSLLHMCAMSAIQHDLELKAFYNRRLAMGKHKMSTLNVLRNKILSRIWSCVKGERDYVPGPVQKRESLEKKRVA